MHGDKIEIETVLSRARAIAKSSETQSKNDLKLVHRHIHTRRQLSVLIMQARP
jgi:hypothetical protein